MTCLFSVQRFILLEALSVCRGRLYLPAAGFGVLLGVYGNWGEKGGKMRADIVAGASEIGVENRRVCSDIGGYP